MDQSNDGVILNEMAQTDAPNLIVLKVAGPLSHPNTRHALVEISPDDFDRLGATNNQIALLTNKGAPSQEPVYITFGLDSTLQGGEIRLAKGLIKRLESPEEVELDLSTSFDISCVLLQSVEKIEDGQVSVSESLMRELLSDSNVKEVDIRHLCTGATLSVRVEDIVPDSTLQDDQIRLNFLQRQALNIPSKFQSDADRERLLDKFKRVNRDSNTDSVLQDDGTVELPAEEWQRLQIVPVTYRGSIEPSLYERFCDWIIGKAELNLIACRPYRIDDARDVVRLSPDNMALLGVEDTDNIELIYRNKSCRVMVMSIDSPELIERNNIMLDSGDAELMVGIPAPIRATLGIDDLETSLTVKRDCRYLFKKNANLQLVPLAALFLTVLQLGEIDFWIKLLICIIASPFVIYATLSQERNKIDKKRKRREQ